MRRANDYYRLTGKGLFSPSTSRAGGVTMNLYHAPSAATRLTGCYVLSIEKREEVTFNILSFGVSTDSNRGAMVYKEHSICVCVAVEAYTCSLIPNNHHRSVCFGAF